VDATTEADTPRAEEEAIIKDILREKTAEPALTRPISKVVRHDLMWKTHAS
jgi:hypothetical protein